MWIIDINKWFEQYDKWVHQAERAKRLGLAWEQEDKLLNVTYHSVDDLDVCAEEMRKQYKIKKEQYDAEMKKRGAK